MKRKQDYEQTGLYYYGARYYNPRLSVWLSVDPLYYHPNQVDKSPYAYVWNNPVNLVDPDGRCPDCPDASTAREGDVANPHGTEYIFSNGEWTGQGGNLAGATVTAQGGGSSSSGGFGQGLLDGFGAGVGSTVNFFKSLGTEQGWKDLGQGMLDFSMLNCQACPQGMMMRTQMADQMIDYAQNIPNMSAYEMGYDLGFGTEKALEIAITRRVTPMPKSSLGIRNVGDASRFTTIQSTSTYGRWGKLNQRMGTWTTGGSTLDRATFYNRNFIIPAGRVVGAGQLQHLQR
ncbi:MAG: RHS repeat-associated core domain-containing protein [Cryomorphaceae bacterium]|nr:RHS repeat-associated core domain-containing protein [Cryomorphaceae bacterium]